MHLSSSLLFGLLGSALAAPSPEHNSDFDDYVPTSYTNSAGKRSTLWIHKSYERDSSASDKRELKPVIEYYEKDDDDQQDACRDSSFEKGTNKESPFADGCRDIAEWHRENPGVYHIGLKKASGDEYVKIMISDGDTGANCVFGVRHQAMMAKIGNTDIADLIEESLSRYTETIDGKERVEAWGTMGCLGDMVEDGEAAMDWWIYGSKAPA